MDMKKELVSNSHTVASPGSEISWILFLKAS